MTTALDKMVKSDQGTVKDGGPSAKELVKLLEQCDISSSRSPTPYVSPAPSVCNIAPYQLGPTSGPWVKQSEADIEREGATGGDYMETLETDTHANNSNIVETDAQIARI